jgi:hypothetical protein
MRTSNRPLAALLIGLAAAAVCLCGAAQPQPSATQPQPSAAPPQPSGPPQPGRTAAQPDSAPGSCNNQSPRALAGVAFDREPFSKVHDVTEQTVSFKGQLLHRCSQHFHCRIENFQGCEGQSVSPIPGPHECPAPPAGSWVEVHTAYAAQAGCVGPVSKCCLAPPFVVLGYHAKVAPEGAPGRLPVIRDGPFAEWLGSTTGTGSEEGGDPCKPEAEWSFTLGCDFSVTAGQLGPHGEGARPLQERVSRDLKYVRQHP